MKTRAVLQCKQEQKAYYECVKGRTLSVVRPRDAAAPPARVSGRSSRVATHAGLGVPSLRGRYEQLPTVRPACAAGSARWLLTPPCAQRVHQPRGAGGVETAVGKSRKAGADWFRNVRPASRFSLPVTRCPSHASPLSLQYRLLKHSVD